MRPISDASNTGNIWWRRVSINTSGGGGIALKEWL
jgi:hypothetical protein